MSNNFQVVLLKDVPNLGQGGEIVSVKSGYFRNFLLPKDLAAPLGSPQVLKILEGLKEKKTEKKRQMALKEKKKIEQAEKRQAMIKRKAALLKKRKSGKIII